MRILYIAARWLFILCFPVLLVTASQSWAVNSLWLYEYGFRKYNVSQSTGMTEEELVRAARGLIDYFNSGEEFISPYGVRGGEPFELFTEIEIRHLRDVRILFRLGYYFLGGALAFIIIYT
ncbi:DUF1461 domain-containing protein, partial [Dehalococcoidia bacterium]|nr:DUF1461 domain-containing protein [Dehalococcoidia bacterium]